MRRVQPELVIATRYDCYARDGCEWRVERMWKTRSRPPPLPISRTRDLSSSRTLPRGTRVFARDVTISTTTPLKTAYSFPRSSPVLSPHLTPPDENSVIVVHPRDLLAGAGEGVTKTPCVELFYTSQYPLRQVSLLREDLHSRHDVVLLDPHSRDALLPH